MRRALATLLCLALVGTLTPAPDPLPLTASDNAAAAGCLWQRHSKRVVKRVGPRGKQHRVVRHKQWWSCAPLPAPPAIPAPTPPIPTPPSFEPEPQPEPTANRVSVTSRDKTGFSYTLSRPQADAGAITIELNNYEGEDAHNLNLQLEGSAEPVHSIAEAAAGQQRAATFDLPAGTYRLWCSLPTHDEQGMHATLVLE